MSKYQTLIDALEAGPVEYACHVDGCVDRTCAFDEGNEVHECGVAQRLSEKGLCKLDCDEWKPINIAKPTIEVKAEDIRALLADLEAAKAALTQAGEFIDDLSQDLHSRRVADWYPEGAHNAASAMSEDMRLLGNRCADFDAIDAALAQMAGGG